MTEAVHGVDTIYKISSGEAFAAAVRTGAFPGMPIDIADGYLHFSTARQLAETLRIHFRGQRDLMLFAVRTADVADTLRWEASRGGDLFPHVYGQLPAALIGPSASVSVGDDGSVALPEWVR